MIRLVSASIGHSKCGRGLHRSLSVACAAMLSAAALCASTTAARSDGAESGSTAPKTYSMVPMHASDHFVQGKYDKTGEYIPPHYEPKSKPPFHGYFFKKKLPDDKTHKDQKVQEPG